VFFYPSLEFTKNNNRNQVEKIKMPMENLIKKIKEFFFLNTEKKYINPVMSIIELPEINPQEH
jgi:hypothetical protein